MKFWERFYELCEKKNEKPNSVCNKLGFSNATATHWKNGAIPKGDALIALSTYFGVPSDFLLGLGIFKDWDKIKENKNEIIQFWNKWDGELAKRFNLNDEITFINLVCAMLAQIDFYEEGITLYPRFLTFDEIMLAYKNNNNDNNGQQAINGNVTVNSTADDKKDTLTEQFIQKIEQLDLDDKVDVMQYVKNKK